MTTQKMQLIIEAENKTKEVLDTVDSSIGKLQTKLESMRPTFQKMALAGTVAFAAISSEIYKSIEAANEAQKVEAQLNAVLKSTGGIAGITASEVLKLSSALQKQTTYGDEAITSAQSLLLTFTSIGKDIFPSATKMVLDMSTALGQDLKSSAIQLGKALQDPILGVTALRRVGVNFNEAQTEVIKNLVETGNAAEAQRLIMKELAAEFGGSASAQAETFAGKIQQLKNRLDDMQEGIGKALIPIIERLTTVIAPIIDKIITWMEQNPKLTGQILLVGAAVAGLVAVMGTLGLILPAVIAGFGLMVGPAGLVVVAIGAIIAVGVILYKHLQEVTDYINANIMPTITLLWNALVGAVRPAFEKLWQTIETQLWPALKNLWTTLETQLGPSLAKLWVALQPVIKAFGVLLFGALILVINSLAVILTYVAKLLTLLTELINFIIKVAVAQIESFTKALNTVVDALKAVYEWGKKAWQFVGKTAGQVGDAWSNLPANLGFTPARASGGLVDSGRSFLVGEHGPEIFTPGNSGRILAGAGIGGITINITGNEFIGEEGIADKIGNDIMRAIKRNIKL